MSFNYFPNVIVKKKGPIFPLNGQRYVPQGRGRGSAISEKGTKTL